MRTTAIIFPFELFGSAGTGSGAQLLGDAIREILDDVARETRPSRTECLRGQVRVRELPFDTTEQIQDWRRRGRLAARQALRAGDFLLWLSGNHLGVLPVFEELGPETLVLQFDAHLDTYDFHDTTRTLSHGNFLRHLPDTRPRVVNIGHRDLFQAATEVSKFFDATYSGEELATELPAVVKSVTERARAAEQVWIDLDCDAVDPAYLPGVTQPLPFGLSPGALLALLNAAWTGRVVGMSVSEFEPGRDIRDTSLNLLGWLLERQLLRRHEGA